MSHNVGTIQAVTPNIVIGPDSGAPAATPNTWPYDFAHTPAPSGTKFVVLHFTGVSLPANNRLEVELGYDTDVFTSADGTDFWTRPINLEAFASGLVPIRYVTDGAATGGATLDQYGRGESLPGDFDPAAISNCDPFLLDSPYGEPSYYDFWFCNDPPAWQNVECIGDPDIRRTVMKSAGMILTVHAAEVSTCSVTCIGPDLVITAGHCFESDDEALTSSVTFDYATECDGTRPAPYNPKFFKVKKLHARVWAGGVDYCILQLEVPPTGLGVTPIQMRSDLPAVGEQVFGIHHPNGAVKKVSRATPDFATVLTSDAGGIQTDFDVSGGSSGSGLFDTAGRILGVLSNGSACNLWYYPTASILQAIAEAPPASPDRDVMIVFDRSGSMSGLTAASVAKIEEARDAASLFVQLIRSGGAHRIGLVSFSSAATAPVDASLAPATAATKNTLVGPAPYSTGIVGALMPGGATSIGDGLEAARDEFPGGGANKPTILLLTDGMQNTPPMIETVEPTLADIDINAIGFGTESNLNGDLLTLLAQNHNGLYTRAGTGLELKKYFALAFGDIFESGALLDPESVLPAQRNESAPVRFRVCDEESITMVVGWEKATTPLGVRLKTPSGATVDASTAGIEKDRGRTWTFLRVALPHGSEREGEWQATVFRQGQHGERGSGAEVRYFLNVLASGGPALRPMPDKRRHYTGETFNPLVQLGYKAGGWPRGGKVKLTVRRPKESVGTLLARTGMRPTAPTEDGLPPRYAALRAMERQSGRPATEYVEETFELHDDPPNSLTFGHCGVFGRPMADLLKVEGNYTFHAVASYGLDCKGSREATWSLHVDSGIDPERTEITTKDAGRLKDGRQRIIVTITPKDKYGNFFGPGRPGDFTVTPTPGTTVEGATKDNGNGSYSVPIGWDPSSGHAPGVVINQPGRAPAPICDTGKERPGHGRGLQVWILALLVLIAALLVALLIAQ